MRYDSIPLHKILLPPQLHRVDVDEQALNNLIRSIEARGLINAISVTAQGDTYQLEAGHRRLLAHQRLGRTHIEAKIYEAADAANGEAIRFAENLEREDLSPMEQGRALAHELDKPGVTLEQLAQMVHRSPAWVEQRLTLLELPLEIAEHVHARRLSIGAALELQKVEDAEHRAYLLRYALEGGATVNVIREWVNQWKLAHAEGAGHIAPRPEMPPLGQPIVIQMPCYVCNRPLPHEQLRILRVCPPCAHALAGSGDAHQAHQPPAPPLPAAAETDRDQHGLAPRTF